MTFVDFNYVIIFLPLVIGLYSFFRKSVFANLIILAASYYFYGSSGIFLLIPLVIASLIDFYVGMWLEASTNERHRKRLLILSIAANMGLLIFFKYASWAMESVNHLLAWGGIGITIPVINIPMLPGVSFYTFQTMSYTIDVYRREMPASRHLINYMAFVTFWPHLVAGPIMRAKNLLAQLEHIRPAITPDIARFALSLIVWGLFKKIVIADNLGDIADLLYNNTKGGMWNGAGLLVAYAFAGQIYCDFSAYTSIARGSAKLVGIELIRNFHTPYLSTSPQDFWRRWHISLSSWLRDYVYIPLGGNRHGKRIECRNIIIVMFLGGLWHGAGVLFIAWGLWHAALLIVYRMLPIERWGMHWGRPGKLLLMFIMFHLVCFGWLMFRSDTTTFMPLAHSIYDLFMHGVNHPFFFTALHSIGLALSCVLVTDYLGYRRGGEFEDLFVAWRPWQTALLVVSCYFAIVFLGKHEGTQFIYFQF